MKAVLKYLAGGLTLTAFLAVMMAVALSVSPAQAMAEGAKAESKRVTVTGEIIDTWCNVTMIMFAEGSAHYQCAVWCAVGGIPVSIKDEDGTVFVVLRVAEDTQNVANPTLFRIQAHEVTVEGDLIERDGVNYLLVSRIADDAGIVKVNHEDFGIQPFGK